MTSIERSKIFKQESFLKTTELLKPRLNSDQLALIKNKFFANYEGEALSVKNILDVMRELFQIIDETSPALDIDARKDACQAIIYELIDQNEIVDKNHVETNALKLLVEYSLDALAQEILSQLNEDESEIDFVIKPEIIEKDRLSRERFENQVNLTMSVKEDVIEGMIEIPSKATSIALAKAAAHNHQAISQQAKEASNYIRLTKLEVDEKVNDVQKKLHQEIEKAIDRIDMAKDALRDVLKGAQELSLDIKGEVAGLVNNLAEKLIEAIQENSPQIVINESENENAVEEKSDNVNELENQTPSKVEIVDGFELPLNELIADIS